MTLTQIASLLNNTIVPNALGAETTIKEDLSNVSVLGTAFANLAIGDLKDYLGQLATGVYYDFIRSKNFKEETYGQYITDQEYGGVMGRIRSKLLPAMDTPIANPISYYDDPSNAPDYHDGRFFGGTWDSEFWGKDVAFMIANSISVQRFQNAFTNARDVEMMISELQKNAEDSLRYKLNELARANIRGLIESAYADNREIKLITTYNTLHGYTSSDPGYVSLTNWNLDPEFKLFCQESIIQLKEYMRDFNEKYNDGTIPNYCPSEDVRSLILTAFSTALDFNQSAVYHDELTSIGEHYRINWWQNQTKDLLPQIKSGSQFDQISVDASTDYTIDHIVGCIFSRYSAFIANKLDKITTDYIAKSDHITTYHHMIKKYGIDGREGCVILTLS